MGQWIIKSTVLNESTINNNMEYSGDILDRLSHNNTNINFEYDERNNVKSIEIGGTVILSKEITYGPSNTHSVTTYGNGFKLKKYYDKYNRLIKVTDVTNNETQICTYIYSDSDVADEVVDPTDSSLTISANSKLYVEIDNIASTRTNYIYDEFGELKEKKKGDIREFFGSRDRFNRPISEYFINGSVSVRKGITYENKNSDIIKHESVQSPTGYTYINYTRDGLERLAKVKVVQGDCGYSKEFSYIARGTEASPEGTTNYVGKVSYYNYANGSDTLEKEEAIEYDADVNIVKYGDNTYAYDNLGRIVRENNKALDKTFVFEYNIGGNIVKKTEYAYTTEALDTVVAASTYEYTYANAWKDQLTSFGGKTITYDGAGNPTTYQGNRLFWSRGRLLTGWSASDGCSAISIAYDANGIRTSKTKTDDYVTTETNFVYDNEGRLRTEIDGEFARNYIYSHQGIEGYEENGERFIYRKNIFGDITAIYNGVTKVAEYAYDAWGNCTITYDSDGYGASNPFRYRGYYWDEDLKMYYLMTRYYDPSIGRFINADTPKYLDPKTLGGLNLYAYCHNNPVMNIDPRGNFAWLVIAAAVLLVACVVSLSSCSKEEEKETEYHYASNDDSIKEGAINYNITPAKDNSEPQIRIFNSHLITDDNKKREILKYIINTDEGKAAGLSESDIEYYVKEWNSHNLVYTFFDFLDIFVDSEEINSYKYRTGHVDCNTDDSKSGIYKIIGGIAGWFW